jgi:hypothetical protein
MSLLSYNKFKNPSGSFKFVPRLLTQDLRDSRIAICQELLYWTSEDENFLKRIVILTGDET